MLRSASYHFPQANQQINLYNDDATHLTFNPEKRTSDLPSGMECPDFNGRPSGFHFKLAQDETARRMAYRLSLRVYHTKGYVDSNRIQSGVAPYSARPDTRVLMICDDQNQIVATATLVFNRTGGLPAEMLFADEVAPLHAQNLSMFEVVRLAVAPTHQGRLLLTTRLLNWAFHYGLIVCGCDELLAEVNPRHVGFYTRLLHFEMLAKARPCSRVSGAPAVLLRLSRSVYMSEVMATTSEIGEKKPSLNSGLYARFLPTEAWDGINFIGVESAR